MFVGKYYRKSGVYNPSDGWCRKWTYKVGCEVSGKKMRLVAMTDGMISQVKGHKQIKGLD